MKITVRGAAAAMVAALALTGCERADPRLKQLAVGITKDSAIAVMQAQPNNVESFLVNGEFIESLFYPEQGKTDSASKAPRKMTPVVTINGKVLGWGWSFWDSLAAAHRIEVPPKPK